MDLGYSILKFLIRKKYEVELTAISFHGEMEWELKYCKNREIKKFLNEFLKLPFNEIEKIWFHAYKPNSFLTFEVRKKKGLDLVRLYEYENCEDVLKFIKERYWIENLETF
jgi:hypothetical protein